jgi:predicted O-linked N-acetylglucosamine transferase (SPINDLY family)
MSLALPTPDKPVQARAASRPVRAFQRWQNGQAHAQREHWPAAALAFEEAFRLQADAAYAHAAAHAFIKAGRSDLALARARALRSAQPRETLAYTLESHALLQLGRAEEAVRCLRELPVGATRDHAFLTSLAVALQRCRRDQEAVAAFMELLAVKIDDPLAHFRLGMSFKDLGLKAQAAECVRTALTLGLAESQLAARGQLVFLEREACNWTAADREMATLRRELAAIPEDRAIQAGAFTQAVLSDDPAEVLKVARLYAQHMARDLGTVPRLPARAHAGRLRIAYLSSDFHQHATSQLMVQMLECHDRTAFEVTLLSTGPDDGSALRQRIVASSERFEDLRGADDGAIARRIRDLGVDVLVDLKGATNDNRMTVLAYRPAPLQVSWLGFPGSSGAPCIDYVIGDAIVTPLEHAAHFSEAIAQLPHCYQPNDAQRALPRQSRRADWDAPADKLLLCAFHQSYKISAEVFDRWCELLHALPNAVLWLLAWNVNVQGRLTAAARERGIAAERLLFAPTLPLADHLSRLAHADIYLDAWPCNAHTTAGEALWVGVPVVTRIGATFAQRVAASLLHAVDLDELVSDDAEGYRDRVLQLAADPARRQQLRAHLVAQRSSGTLFDGARFARDIEALYRRMWDRATAGLAPAHLPPPDAVI